MIKKAVQDTINDQINAEIYSAYLYLSMAADFEAKGFKGCASWMKVQAQEEMVHAMKFYQHLLDRGGQVSLAPIEGPPTQWASPLAAFKAALKHEELVTARINKMCAVARKASDEAAGIMLQWFVTEQVEEEATAGEIVQKLTLAKDSPDALFMIDEQLAARVFVPPAAAGA